MEILRDSIFFTVFLYQFNLLCEVARLVQIFENCIGFFWVTKQALIKDTADLLLSRATYMVLLQRTRSGLSVLAKAAGLFQLLAEVWAQYYLNVWAEMCNWYSQNHRSPWRIYGTSRTRNVTFNPVYDCFCLTVSALTSVLSSAVAVTCQRAQGTNKPLLFLLHAWKHYLR